MLKWDSVPGSILNLAMDGSIVPVLNDAILREYREVLSRPKFHLTDDIVSEIAKNGACQNEQCVTIVPRGASRILFSPARLGISLKMLFVRYG